MLGFLMGLAVTAAVTLLIASKLLKKEERDENTEKDRNLGRIYEKNGR